MDKLKALLLLGILANQLVFCSRKAKTVQEQYSFSNPLVADSITYEFINSALTDAFEGYNFTCSNVLNQDFFTSFLETDDSVRMNSMDTLFTREDISYIYQQYAVVNKFKLNPTLVKNKQLIPLDSVRFWMKKDLWHGYTNRYGEGGFCHITMPLFTKDKSIAIVRKGMICGRTCGEIKTIIYKKVNNKWGPVFTLQNTPEF